MTREIIPCQRHTHACIAQGRMSQRTEEHGQLLLHDQVDRRLLDKVELGDDVEAAPDGQVPPHNLGRGGEQPSAVRSQRNLSTWMEGGVRRVLFFEGGGVRRNISVLST